MQHHIEDRLYNRKMTRRDFLWLTSVSTASFVATGCAVNPVTGDRQLMLISESREIKIDQKNSPHQFSADYGALQDTALNSYINEVGQNIATISHRPQMPYSFRGVNATYINAYAFPGGSVAVTRGILATLNNEAELAGLLGHEIGHINARHTGERLSKKMLIAGTVALATVSLAVYKKTSIYAPVVGILGAVGAGALLAYYSRENERQADALGMEYMNKAGHNPQGMVGIMELLKTLNKNKPGAIEIMFASHPMSDERYQTAKTSAEATYKAVKNMPLNRDRYMDYTARLRRMKPAIDSLQHGEKSMVEERFSSAETHFRQALKIVPQDYAGLVMMTKCLLAQEKPRKAFQYAIQAKQVYSTEAQAHHLGGVANMMANQFDAAYEEFDNYEKMLPGNANTVYLKGAALEGMQNKKAAAVEYARYLKLSNQGEAAQHAHQRLVDWGLVKSQ